MLIKTSQGKGVNYSTGRLRKKVGKCHLQITNFSYQLKVEPQEDRPEISTNIID